MKEKLELYIKDNLINNETKKNNIFNKFKNLYYSNNKNNSNTKFDDYQASYNSKDYVSQEEFDTSQLFKSRNLDTSSINDINKYIESHKNDYNDFQTMLFNLIDERNLKDADVYNKVHIDRRLFSKIRSDKNYHPSKETILLLGFSLELSENEIDKLLESASYSLPKNNYYDLIIRFCFINKIYKLTDINDLLNIYHCKLFNY